MREFAARAELSTARNAAELLLAIAVLGAFSLAFVGAITGVMFLAVYLIHRVL